MKKSSYVALVLGTISGLFFALGMCMALLPEWDAFRPGVALGCAGLVLGLITLAVWRKMTHKDPIHISGKALLTGVIAILGALLLGVGMCFCLVWEKLVLGTVIGVVGLVVLLSLIPLTRGLKEG